MPQDSSEKALTYLLWKNLRIVLIYLNIAEKMVHSMKKWQKRFFIKLLKHALICKRKKFYIEISKMKIFCSTKKLIRYFLQNDSSKYNVTIFNYVIVT